MGNINFKYLIITIFLFLSCKSYKTGFYTDLQGENSYLNNIAIDYFHYSKYIRSYKVFRITLEEEDSLAYYYRILPEINKWPISIKDTIGSFSNYFPTNFKEYKGKLFIWNDRSKPISKGVLNKMNEFNKLDSFWMKVDLGLINLKKVKKEDYPIMTYHDGLRAIHYKIPKSNLSHFKRCKELKKCKF